MTTKVNNEYGCIEIDKHVIAQIAYRSCNGKLRISRFLTKNKRYC